MNTTNRRLKRFGARVVLGGSALVLALAAALPAAAQTNFATLATNGVWTWYNDPRALFHNGQLYFGYVRSDGKTALSTMNLATGVSSNLWVSGFTQVDDHNNPGLLSKQDGTLLAIYARHGSDQYFAYRRSLTTNPVVAADWAAEQQIPNSGATMTYANPFQLSAEGGKIYDFCRNTNYNPTIFTSTNGGSNWSSPQWFIRTGAGGTRPYVKYASDYQSRIDFLYTDGHPRDVNNSLYHLYYRSNAFYQTDGTLLKNYASLPILHDGGERGTVIYQYSAAAQSDPNQWIPTGRAWCWETAYQTNGAPVCVFTVQRDLVAGSTSGIDDRIYYYYARWTGSAWQKRFIAHAGRPLYVAEDDYAGGICVDPQNPNVIYISSNAQDPFDLSTTTNVPLSATQRYELWRGVTSDGGLTFAWTQITTNSAEDNLRPYIPRRNGGEPSVIWFRGNYSTYTSYDCDVVGLFTSAPPPPPPPPPAPVELPVTYVDATSGVGGNTTLAGGATFTPPLNGTTGLDNDWEQRTVLGSGGNIYEAGGESVNENVPELRTTITNLIPGASYATYVFFWDPTSTTEDWSIRAGFAANPGANALFCSPDATGELAGSTGGVLASSLTFAVAPTIFLESARDLRAGRVGVATADGGGTIKVFVDDRPAGGSVNLRTWFDGVGHARLVSTQPTNLVATVASNQVTVSWPVGHTGWRLQSQSNSLGVGLRTNWTDVPGATNVNQIMAPLCTAAGGVFFRMVWP